VCVCVCVCLSPFDVLLLASYLLNAPDEVCTFRLGCRSGFCCFACLFVTISFVRITHERKVVAGGGGERKSPSFPFVGLQSMSKVVASPSLG
jgi:hypothetical protein